MLGTMRSKNPASNIRKQLPGASPADSTEDEDIDRRLRKLEDQFGPADGKPGILLVACRAGWGLALDQDTRNRKA